MTQDESTSGKSKKGRVSVAQRLQTNAQLSPRSQDDPDERETERKQMDLGKYDKATIRIIAQFLDNIGLQNSVEALVEETGFTIETSAGARIRSNIMKGNYDAACDILEQARDLPQETSQNAGYIIQCFKLADLVRKGRYFDALFTMKSMAPIVFRDESKNMEYFDSFVKDIMLGGNRYQHLDSVTERESQLTFLEELLPSDFILPQNRLKSILNKVHGPATDEKASKLLRDDTQNTPKGPPYRQVQLWEHRNSPIYCVKFSRNGKLMASGGRSNLITIWETRSGQLKRLGELSSITEGDIGYMEFCQQNKYILVCGGASCKYNLTIFDVASRVVCRTLRVAVGHDDNLDLGTYFSCATFLTEPLTNRTRLVAGNELGALKVYDLNIDSNAPIRTQGGFRVRCLYGMKNGDFFLMVDALNRVRLYSISAEKMEGTTICKEEVTIINMTVHPSEKFVLTATEANLRLWDVRNHNLVRVFTGACQREEFNRYSIHSSFGGVHQQFIATGSIGKESDESLRDNDKSKRKNGRVVIWSVEESRPKFELIGHKGHVNGVAWHPKDPTMLVSCGDDSTIRVWSLNRSETSDYSQVIPRRIPRNQKKQKTEPKVTEPVLNTKQELMRSLREQIKNMSTKNDFETDLKMEQLWIQRANHPKWAIDEEAPQTM
ncbi:hypothetical protein CRE_18492 [Caenorhabditis remanei]|uniref:Uncharacterized protein n=1 Tax=Caenorhabditis remanei TaxID=31234 RepID=E3LKV1_CAERE|nr:hypothetical protein CRE_18492 [Caenorhabditis remanei]